VKLERETDAGYQRWTFETHPWVEKALAIWLLALLGGAGAAIAGPVARLFGW
jgi:hypothetical protein